MFQVFQVFDSTGFMNWFYTIIHVSLVPPVEINQPLEPLEKMSQHSTAATPPPPQQKHVKLLKWNHTHSGKENKQ